MGVPKRRRPKGRVLCNWDMCCPFRARWIVGIGTRQCDRQLSCGTHLHQTCLAMYEAENRKSATLTVTPLEQEEERQ